MKYSTKPREYKIVYPALEKYMEDKNLSYEEFGYQAGVARNTLHRVLTGDVNPSKKTIDGVLKVTGMTYEEAFTE